MDSVSTDTRDALLIDTGSVYCPPATRNSVPGGVRMICAGVLGAPAGLGAVGAEGCAASRGGVVGGAPGSAPVGGFVTAPGCVGAAVGGAVGGAPTGGTGVTTPGMGDVPGGSGGFVGGTPGGAAA